MVPRGQAGSITTTATVERRLIAPLSTTTQVGELQVVVNGKPVTSVPLYPLANVPQGGIWSRLSDTVLLWFQKIAARVAEPLPICYLNGSLMPLREARISPLDRSFLFGDGVYEVIPARRGQARRLAANLARLSHSLRELRIRNPHSDCAMERHRRSS